MPVPKITLKRLDITGDISVVKVFYKRKFWFTVAYYKSWDIDVVKQHIKRVVEGYSDNRPS